MKKLLPQIIAVTALVVGTFLLQKPALAVECHSVYGGGQVCEEGQLEINKQVWDPSESEWQDNVDSNDHSFKAGDEMKYRLIIKNTGEVRINDIEVFDRLPEDATKYITYQSGGNWDSANRTVWFDKFGLNEDEETTKEIIFKVKGEGDLLNGVVCLTDRGEVRSQDDNDDDSATACIKKGTEQKKTVLGITSFPTTGPSIPVVLALETLGFAGLGLAYLRTNRKYS